VGGGAQGKGGGWNRGEGGEKRRRGAEGLKKVKGTGDDRREWGEGRKGGMRAADVDVVQKRRI